VPTQTFCQQHPELCVPPNGPSTTQVVSTAVAGGVGYFVGSAVQKAVAITGITAVGVGSIAMFLVANPFSFFDIFLWISRLWSLLLIAFGIKKKANPWGTVYDSVTKQPIDPAYVVLYNSEGREVATSITDIEGRYGFAVPPGTYTIVANKTNYVFPSTKLAGKTEDELYGNLYFGGQIVVEKDGDIIGKNIPMDAVGFDWNEYAKNQQSRLRHFHRRDVLIAQISHGLFVAGFIITGVATIVSPTVFNLIMSGLYVVLAVLQILGITVRPMGGVSDYTTNMPIPFSVVRVYSTVTNKEIMHRVADARGRYYALMANGTYRVVVDRKNPDQSYTPTPITGDIPVKRGYLKELFKI
jgi:Na+-transporting methylmalonyl-CoA/oxaloacetate decarboxylase gamma subunit